MMFETPELEKQIENVRTISERSDLVCCRISSFSATIKRPHTVSVCNRLSYVGGIIEHGNTWLRAHDSVVPVYVAPRREIQDKVRYRN